MEESRPIGGYKSIIVLQKKDTSAVLPTGYGKSFTIFQAGLNRTARITDSWCKSMLSPWWVWKWEESRGGQIQYCIWDTWSCMKVLPQRQQIESGESPLTWYFKWDSLPDKPISCACKNIYLRSNQGLTRQAKPTKQQQCQCDGLRPQPPIKFHCCKTQYILHNISHQNES